MSTAGDLKRCRCCNADPETTGRLRQQLCGRCYVAWRRAGRPDDLRTIRRRRGTDHATSAPVIPADAEPVTAEEDARDALALLLLGADLPDADELLDALLDRPAWHADALCKEYPSVTWFPGRGDNVRRAIDVCRRCLVRSECIAWAEAHPWADDGTPLTGIWGGVSMRARRLARQQDQHPGELAAVG